MQNVFRSPAHILPPNSINFLFMQLTENSVMHYTEPSAPAASLIFAALRQTMALTYLIPPLPYLGIG
jgi:hypothetical protein